jgi:hypothetical protein
MRLTFAFVVAAVFAAAAPAAALQSITLPQPGDNATSPQDPNAAQDQFSSGQNDGKRNSLGSFHFGVTSGSQWPDDPWRSYRPQTSTPDAYGNASTPGSEFSNSGYLFPH